MIRRELLGGGGAQDAAPWTWYWYDAQLKQSILIISKESWKNLGRLVCNTALGSPKMPLNNVFIHVQSQNISGDVRVYVNIM